MFGRSTRGSIRQAPSCITWLTMLRRLQTTGCSDPLVVIKEWNEQASKASSLTGGKALTVRLLLEKAPAEITDILVSHSSQHGWAICAFSDDCLATKKVAHI